MKPPLRFLFLPVIFFCIQNIYSLDIDITDKNVQAYYRGEYTRGSDMLNEISIGGLIELERVLTFKGKFSAGRTMIDTDINMSVNISYAPFLRLPFIFALSWYYNGLPEYKAHSNSLLPFVSFNGRITGFAFGCNLRFSTFFGEPACFESIFSFYGYFNFINNGILRIGFGVGNFNEYHARNLGSYFLDIYASIKINKNFILVNNIELMQSGGDGLTTTFLGIAFRTGVKFTW